MLPNSLGSRGLMAYLGQSQRRLEQCQVSEGHLDIDIMPLSSESSGCKALGINIGLQGATVGTRCLFGC